MDTPESNKINNKRKNDAYVVGIILMIVACMGFGLLCLYLIHPLVLVAVYVVCFVWSGYAIYKAPVYPDDYDCTKHLETKKEDDNKNA